MLYCFARLSFTLVLMLGGYPNAIAASTDPTSFAPSEETEPQTATLAVAGLGQEVVARDAAAMDFASLLKKGISFKGVGDANSLQINSRIQLDARHFDSLLDPTGRDELDIRRAYLTLKGVVLSHYDFNVTADFAQPHYSAKSSVLDVAYVGVNWWPNARIRLGQFDMPFGLEHLTSDLFNDFQERSLANALTPGKEWGAMLYGSPYTGMTYALAGSSGRGKNTHNQDANQDTPDLIGRATYNAARWSSHPDLVLHLGIDASYGEVSANQATGSDQLSPGGFKASSFSTDPLGIKFFTPGKFSSTYTEHPVQRHRYGVEAAIAIGSMKVQAEWLQHRYSGINSSELAFNKSMNAAYLSAVWMLTGEQFAPTYKDGIWTRMQPRHNAHILSAGRFSQYGAGVGAVSVGMRYSMVDASDFDAGTGVASIKTGESTTRAAAWTLGVKWLPNANTALMLNYTRTRFVDPLAIKNAMGTSIAALDAEKVISLRAQLDF